MSHGRSCVTLSIQVESPAITPRTFRIVQVHKFVANAPNQTCICPAACHALVNVRNRRASPYVAAFRPHNRRAGQPLRPLPRLADDYTRAIDAATARANCLARHADTIFARLNRSHCVARPFPAVWDLYFHGYCCHRSLTIHQFAENTTAAINAIKAMACSAVGSI